MKNIKYLLFLVLTVALLTSCFFNPAVEDTASISLKLNPGASSRALNGEITHARVFLLSDGYSLLKFQDGNYHFEAENSSGEIVITGVPSGNWNVLLSLGKLSEGVFEEIKYGESGEIFLSPGVKNEVNIALKESPFTVSATLSGKNVRGVVGVGTKVYATSGNILYEGASSVYPMSEIPALPEGYSINSLSRGMWFDNGSSASELWINTTKGIVPYRGGDYKTDFPQENPVSVLKSGAMYFPVDEDRELPAILIYYRRPKGFGGIYIDTENLDPANWEWTNVDLSESLAGELIYDFTIRKDYGYFASSIGAFRLSEAVMREGDSDIVAQAEFFSIKEGGEEVVVFSLDFDEEAGRLYIGTEKGVYSATPHDTEVLANITRIGNTEGYPFFRVSVSKNYAAFLTVYDLFILDKSTTPAKLYKLRFNSGFPGSITGMDWINDGETLVLSGAGDRPLVPFAETTGASPIGEGGLVSLDMSKLEKLEPIY